MTEGLGRTDTRASSSSARRAILHIEAGYIYADCPLPNFKPLAVRRRTIHSVVLVGARPLGLVAVQGADESHSELRRPITYAVAPDLHPGTMAMGGSMLPSVWPLMPAGNQRGSVCRSSLPSSAACHSPSARDGATGIWHPDNRVLTGVRTAIARDAEQWAKVRKKLTLEGDRLCGRRVDSMPITPLSKTSR